MSHLITTDNYSNQDLARLPGGDMLIRLFGYLIKKRILSLSGRQSESSLLTGSLISESVDNGRFNGRVYEYSHLVANSSSHMDIQKLISFTESLVRCIETGSSNAFHLRVSLARALEHRFFFSIASENEFDRIPFIQALYDFVMKVRPSSITVLDSMEFYKRFITSIAQEVGITPVKVKSCPESLMLSSLLKAYHWLSWQKEMLSRGSMKEEVAYFDRSVHSSWDELPKKSALFFAYDERRMHRILDIAKAMREMNGARPFTIAFRSDCQKILNSYFKAGFQGAMMHSLLPRGEAEKLAKSMRKRLFDVWRSVEEEDDELMLYEYHGVPLFQHFSNRLKGIFIRFGIRVALAIEVFHRALEESKASVAVLFDQSDLSHALNQVCSMYGVPTLYYYYLFTSNQLILKGLRTIRADFWAVSSEKVGKYLLEEKQPPAERLTVVGDVFADACLYADRRELRMRLCQQLELDEMKKIIVLVSGNVTPYINLETKRRVICSIFDAVRQLDVQMIIKAHPNESKSALQKMMRELQVECSLLQTEPLRSVLAASDLVCMFYAQAGIEAMSFGIPVISMMDRHVAEDVDKHFNYLSSGAVAFVPADEDPLPAVEKLLFDPIAGQEQIERGYQYAEKFMGPLDGKSAERMARLINVIAQREESFPA